MHRKFQKAGNFSLLGGLHNFPPLFPFLSLQNGPSPSPFKNKSKPVRDRLAHAPLKTARRRPRFRQICMISAVAHSLSARQTAAASRLRGPAGQGPHVGQNAVFLPGGQAAAQRGRILRGGDRMGKALPVGGQGAGVVEIQVVEQPRPRSGARVGPHRSARYQAT